ncbi:Uncharacterized protein C05D11.1 [Eumeta japonica]|uniref:Uncharacterized protein C05D11.1 n=1 Tax=Eumeta variegata TaxID=151549 RepID=A0A4C1U9H7_EUMVA|nr:Uncharacterized protein C05D11.1 [Eumeta japonica]
MAHFKLKSSTKAAQLIPVNKYISERTGLTVIIADVEGPLVNGFFCLATEAHDDDGLPHTLEHLVFLGSKRYPYKGILDLLANRCIAHGTNAWTDTDHTCYTICTVGAAGMLTLLPIYLDHILRPTLTDHGFVTEVHHIDGEGEDAGVVYCEMQGRENNASSKCDLRLLRAIYPNNGYSAETGGIMKNLRESTNNKKVRDFHKKFYRAENLTIILTGQVDVIEVFKALAVVEDDIMSQKEEGQEEWVKPWQIPPPSPIYGDYEEQWPADTEDCGEILFGWRGPLLTEPNALKELTACAILLRYLCETATAPLQHCLVEREDALAGDVSFLITENLSPLLRIELHNVPINKLQLARDTAKQCLEKIRSGADDIDILRMHRLLRKQLRESMVNLETDPHHAVAFQCIGDSLYSQNEQNFIDRLNPQEMLHALMDEPSKYWLQLLQKYFTKDMVVVMGSPSIALQTKMAEEDKQRIECQRSTLGDEGLAEKAKILQEAIEFNERPPPPGTLTSVPVPSCDNLGYLEISSWAGCDGCPYFDLNQVPLYTRIHSLKTNFVYINIILDMTMTDQGSRKWLPLFMNALGECPVRRGSDLIPHEQVISTTESLTAVLDFMIGFNHCGNFSVGQHGNFAIVEAKCEPSDYEAVVDHLYEILYAAELNKERLLVFIQRLINDVAQVRRNGHKMVYDTLRDSLYSKDSNMHWCSVLRQQKFLKELLDQMNSSEEAALSVVAAARDAFTKITKTIWLHLATDLTKYRISPEPWKKFENPNAQVPWRPGPYWDADLMHNQTGGFVVGVGGVESNFLAQFTPGPRYHNSGDMGPLYVAINYFTQLEGPMWRLIRGSGLSYGYSVRPYANESRIAFALYRASNPVGAYAKAKSIIEEFLAGGEIDEELLTSARSTALFEVVENEKSPADVVTHSLLTFCMGVKPFYNRELMCVVANVTKEEAREATAAWLGALFQPEKANIAIVCHPSKVLETQAAFEK